MGGVLLIFLILSLGFITGFLFKWVLDRGEKYNGTIYVKTEEDKTVYSLELDDYVETLRFKKRLVFKVDTSDESPIRR